MSYAQDDTKQNEELRKLLTSTYTGEPKDPQTMHALPMCGSKRQDYFLGAIVHPAGECTEHSLSVLVQDVRKLPWARCWRAYRARDGMFHAVPEHPNAQVICGETDDALWVLEKHETNWILRNMRDALKGAEKDIAHFGGDTYPPGHFEELMEWKPIMRPQALDKALVWAKKKRDDGMTVRLRNTKTHDIIMGDVL